MDTKKREHFPELSVTSSFSLPHFRPKCDATPPTSAAPPLSEYGFENIKQIPSRRKVGWPFVFQRVQKIEDRLRRTSKQTELKKKKSSKKHKGDYVFVSKMYQRWNNPI